MSEEESVEVPTVEVVDLQERARRWAHARREARRWSTEADLLAEQLLAAMETGDLHGVAGEDWIVRVARRPRYFGSSPERVREVVGPEAAPMYVHEVIDWAGLIKDYGPAIVDKLGASRAETAYLALGTRKEEGEP